MRKFKGTNGNWNINKSIREETGRIIIENEDRKQICELDLWREAGKNGKLIAASPDLLQACISAESGIRQLANEGSLAASNSLYLILKAIEKALS